ncbi:MAG: HAD family hydrolase [Calditrichaeota bacterium]|nr:MAG: HAD family hydrolase [Calditrichota bacterium]
MIKGITFDLWDTVFIDDSDEPKRLAAGRPSKAEERRILMHRFVNRHISVSKEQVSAVYDAVDAAFRKVWHEQFVTWNVHDRLALILKGFQLELPAAEMAELVRLHEEMELEFKPDFISGVHEAIHNLKANYKLCVISDTIFSPGRTLRGLLAGENLFDCFDGFVFSDELGFSKPHPDVFKSAAGQLGLPLHELVHIGDREHNDIAGPQALGMKTILCTAAIDRDSANTKADGKISDYSNLVDVINAINQV